MDATAAWYGFGLIIFSVFNLVFLPAYYTSGYKAGVSFLSAMLPVILFMAAVEILVHFPIFYWMDSTSPEDLLRQLPILIFGLFLYAVSYTHLATSISELLASSWPATFSNVTPVFASAT